MELLKLSATEKQMLEMAIINREIQLLYDDFQGKIESLTQGFDELGDQLSGLLGDKNFDDLQDKMVLFRESSPYIDYVSMISPPGLVMGSGRGELSHREEEELDALLDELPNARAEEFARIITLSDDMNVLLTRFISTVNRDGKTALLSARLSLLNSLGKEELMGDKNTFILNFQTGTAIFPPDQEALPPAMILEIIEKARGGGAILNYGGQSFLATIANVDEQRAIGVISDLSRALKPGENMSFLLRVSSLFLAFCLFLLGVYIWDLHSLSNRLQRLNDQLIEAHRLKNDLISMVSHDLKTPVARIIGTASAASATKDYHGALDEIKNSARQLDRFITNILQTKRLEDEISPLNLRPGDILMAVEEAVKSISAYALSQKVEIIVKSPPVSTLIFDEKLVTGALVNLLANGVKYSPSQGEILVEIREKKDEIQIFIKDSGPGIDEKDREKIFEKYYRAQDQNKTGMGLGLYLVQRIANIHGGRVFIDDKVKDGLGIFFCLPL